MLNMELTGRRGRPQRSFTDEGGHVEGCYRGGCYGYGDMEADDSM